MQVCLKIILKFLLSAFNISFINGDLTRKIFLCQSYFLLDNAGGNIHNVGIQGKAEEFSADDGVFRLLNSRLA